MLIDLTKLSYQDELVIDEELRIDESIYQETDIKDLSPVKVNAILKYTVDEELSIELKAKGRMILEDAISTKEISHDFELETEEILESFDNSIDIIDILWQNIVLEIPLRKTLEKDLSKYKGEGWKLIEERKTSLADLIENIEKE